MNKSTMKKFSFLNEEITFKYLDKKHSFPKHMHVDSYMIGIPLKGTSAFNIEKKIYDIKVGQLVVIAPYLVHACQPNKSSKDWKFLNFHISKNTLQKILETFCKEKTNFIFEDYIIDDEILAKRFENLIVDILEKEKINQNEMTSLLSILLKKHSHFKEDIKDLNKTKFKPLFEYFKKEEYCLKHLDFYKMANIMKMNPYYFHRIFSKTIGLTPQNFINLLRVSKATKLLETKKSLATIALESGFYDQAYFTKQFKKRHGLTPTRYKKIS